MSQRNILIAAPSTGEEEWLGLKDTIFSGWLTQGPKVAEFEQQFAQRHQVSHALATTSCTTALHLILTAMGIGEGDEVIVPAFTWIATANVVLYCGAKPIFIDVDPLTYNMNPDLISQKLTSKTKAIIVVHLFGLCADMDAICAVANGVPIIEDAACAAGASYKRRPAGSLGLAAAFSFHPRKSITTGEGGMVTTNDAQLAERMNCLRNHGASLSEEQRHNGSRPYLLPDFNLLGFNYRMTDLQASVGLVQLRKLDAFIVERQRLAKVYCDELSVVPWLNTPVIAKDCEHAWQAFVCQVTKSMTISRNEVMQQLLEKGIHTRPGTHSVVSLGYYMQNQGTRPQDYPAASAVAENTLALPLHNKMNEEDIDYVIAAIKQL